MQNLQKQSESERNGKKNGVAFAIWQKMSCSYFLYYLTQASGYNKYFSFPRNEGEKGYNEEEGFPLDKKTGSPRN